MLCVTGWTDPELFRVFVAEFTAEWNRLQASAGAGLAAKCRLRIAPKTVEYHVCAVLAKLDVSTRKQAARHPVTRALFGKSRESITAS